MIGGLYYTCERLLAKLLVKLFICDIIRGLQISKQFYTLAAFRS
jgi:hypothetical protein